MQQRIAASEYAVRPDGERFRAHNRAHNFLAQIDTRGAELRLYGGQGKAVRIAGATLGRGTRVTPLASGKLLLGACRTDGALDVEGTCLKRLESQRGAVTELWENRTGGLEHSFVVHQSPAGRGELSVFVSVEDAKVTVAPNGTEARIVQRREALSFRYSGLRAWDATGKELAARMQAATGGIALVVDDANATYPVTIDPLLVSLAWTAVSDQALAGFGQKAAGAGDVNGDGFDDVIVAAWLYNGAYNDSGRVFAYHGSVTGLGTSAAWTADGSRASKYFGKSAASAGDVNADGFDDVIVVASGTSYQAYLYLGSASGLGAVAAWTMDPPVGQALTSVTRAGDVNGDGFDDVVFGNCNYSGSSGCRALVYHGGANGLGSGPATTLGQGWEGVGSRIATAGAGDINGDGFDDVIVGARGDGKGRASVYLGSAAGIAVTAAWSVEGQGEHAQFADAVASAGDVNGDGFSDVIVGSQYYDNGQSNEGAAFVYLGGAAGLTTSDAWMMESDQPDALFGSSVASAGDVNADGFSDVIVGAPLFSAGHVEEGRAFMYLGNATGLSTAVSWSADGDEAHADFGASVASAGDVNGDGLGDIIVGAPGDYSQRAFVFLGSAIECIDADGDYHPSASCGGDDQCDLDVNKVALGACGCGVADIDTDRDGTADCIDGCPYDPSRSAPPCPAPVPGTSATSLLVLAALLGLVGVVISSQRRSRS